MKKFLKDNLVLTLGISLPLLLVVLFIVAGALPKYWVEDPKYDVLFSDGKYSYVEFQVQQQKLFIKVDPVRYLNEKSLPHLYRYVAATGNVQEITFQTPDMSNYRILEGSSNRNGISANIVITVDPTKLPSQEQAQDTSKVVSEISNRNNTAPFLIPVAEVATLNIDTAPLAPDGYQFFNGGYNYDSGGLLFLGIGGSYRNNGPVLSKNGKNIPVSYKNLRDSYYPSLNFIGWVIP